MVVKNVHEIWSLLGRPLRFSLHEFAAIMDCDPIDESGNFDANHHEFGKEMGVSIIDGPKFKELEEVMDLCKA